MLQFEAPMPIRVGGVAINDKKIEQIRASDLLL
jgi:hypothetical protein